MECGRPAALSRLPNRRDQAVVRQTAGKDPFPTGPLYFGLDPNTAVRFPLQFPRPAGQGIQAQINGLEGLKASIRKIRLIHPGLQFNLHAEFRQQGRFFFYDLPGQYPRVLIP